MKILILTNFQLGLYRFRKEILEKLIFDKHRVYVSVPDGEFTRELKCLGVKLILDQYLDRRGTNPIQDIRLLNYYKSMLRKIKPDVVFTYTIKPNVYGGYLCGKLGIPYIANVTGLGTAIQNGGLIKKLTLILYRVGLRKAQKVFFQNEENLSFMITNHVVAEGITDILPGSGVNTEEHCYEPYPNETDGIIFTTIGRIMKDKGIDELLDAAEIIKARHPDAVFRLIGDFDEEYETRVRDLDEKGIIEYLGFQKEVHRYLSESHAVINASYHEGMNNVLQEAASTGRPVIATNIHGCKEIYDDGITGISFKARSRDSLVDAIEKFIKLDNEQKKAMGIAGRDKMEREFSRTIVVNKYLDEISQISGSKGVLER